MFCVIFISTVLLAKRLGGGNKENGKLSGSSFSHYLEGPLSFEKNRKILRNFFDNYYQMFEPVKTIKRYF